MKKTFGFFVLTSLLSFSALASEGILVLQLSGDSGSTIATLNKMLKAKGLKERLPESLELNSGMTRNQINDIHDELNALAGKASDEYLVTSAYGEIYNGKATCFKGDNTKIDSIYYSMVDVFVSDQFTVMATSTKDPNRVGIKFDETDSGSEGSWINIRRCK